MVLANLKNKNYQECVKLGQQILEKDGKNVKILHRISVALIAMKEYDKAQYYSD